MDMNAVYGGFAANIAAANDPVWVMNVVPAFGPNTLHAIYDRGLLGVVHDWQVPLPSSLLQPINCQLTFEANFIPWLFHNNFHLEH
jgi:hypothetical protein